MILTAHINMQCMCVTRVIIISRVLASLDSTDPRYPSPSQALKLFPGWAPGPAVKKAEIILVPTLSFSWACFSPHRLTRSLMLQCSALLYCWGLESCEGAAGGCKRAALLQDFHLLGMCLLNAHSISFVTCISPPSIVRIWLCYQRSGVLQFKASDEQVGHIAAVPHGLLVGPSREDHRWPSSSLAFPQDQWLSQAAERRMHLRGQETSAILPLLWLGSKSTRISSWPTCS